MAPGLKEKFYQEKEASNRNDSYEQKLRRIQNSDHRDISLEVINSHQRTLPGKNQTHKGSTKRSDRLKDS